VDGLKGVGFVFGTARTGSVAFFSVVTGCSAPGSVLMAFTT
jgi:hypothetical protein